MSTRNQRPQVWTVEAVRELGLTTDVPSAAAILGIGRSMAYEMIKNDEFPVRLIRARRRVLVPTSDLINLLDPPRRDIA